MSDMNVKWPREEGYFEIMFPSQGISRGVHAVKTITEAIDLIQHRPYELIYSRRHGRYRCHQCQCRLPDFSSNENKEPAPTNPDLCVIIVKPHEWENQYFCCNMCAVQWLEKLEDVA